MAEAREGDEGIRVERRPGGGERRYDGPGDATPNVAEVREEDLEPHAGLRYVARLFKLLSVLLILLLIGEVVLNLIRQGGDAVPFLLVEATRLIVFAGLLWGAADMALMLIESNHDLRATRILVGRMNAKIQRLEEASSVTPPPPGTRRGGANDLPQGPPGY